VLVPISHSFCNTIPGVVFSATVSAVAVRAEPNGPIITLTNVAIVPSIDATPVGRDVCKDVEIDVAGPVDEESSNFEGFGLSLLSQCRLDPNSVGLQITYTQFSLKRF
jgi:hypothetical protein